MAEMPEGTKQAEMMVKPPMEERRDPNPATDGSEMEEIVMDTPPRNDEVEKEEEGCTKDTAPGGAPEVTPARAPVSMPDVEEPAGNECSLVVPPPQVVANPEQTSGSDLIAGSQPTRVGSSGAVFRLRPEEEAVMDTMRQHLCGRADRIRSFARASRSGRRSWSAPLL